MERRPLMYWVLTLLLFFGSGATHASNSSSFYIGVSPHTSPRNLMTQFKPLRERFEHILSQPVHVVTALNFTQFIERALTDRYDLVMTTSHQALLLVERRGYIPLLTYKAQFHGLVVTSREDVHKPLNSFNNTAVIGLNPSSLVTLWGETWLQQNQLKPSRISYITASDSAIRQLIKHRASLVFMSLPDYASLPDNLRQQIAILARSPGLPGRVYALSPRWQDQTATIRNELLDFANSPEGKVFLATYHLQGMRPLAPGELEKVRPYMQRMVKHIDLEPTQP